MLHNTAVPAEILRKWQGIVDLLADIVRVPSALIMRVEPSNIKVLVASEAEGNPYEPGEKPRIAWSANELRGLSAFGAELTSARVSRCRLRVKRRKAQTEHNISAVPLQAAVRRPRRHVCNGANSGSPVARHGSTVSAWWAPADLGGLD